MSVNVEMEECGKEGFEQEKKANPDGSEDAALLLDLEDRDPNRLNHKTAVLFEDVIGEPEGAHSAPKVYRTSYRAYWAGKNCCFKALTFICSVPMGFCWGCCYGLMSFCQIWHLTPCLNLFNQSCVCCASLYSSIVHCCLDPCYEAMALMCTQIWFNHVKGDKGYVSKKMAELNEMKDQDMARV